MQTWKYTNFVWCYNSLNKNPSLNKINELYLLMEKMDSDLQKIIASKQELSDEH